MKYTVVESVSARDRWSIVDHCKSWEEAWKLFSDMKAHNPNMTYHIF